jgi:hypothetical protein
MTRLWVWVIKTKIQISTFVLYALLLNLRSELNGAWHSSSVTTMVTQNLTFAYNNFSSFCHHIWRHILGRLNLSGFVIYFFTVLWVPWALFLIEKQPGQETDHLPQFSVEINTWNCNTTSYMPFKFTVTKSSVPWLGLWLLCFLPRSNQP